MMRISRGWTWVTLALLAWALVGFVVYLAVVIMTALRGWY